MASASDVLETLGKDFLECGICMERYTHPKILDCVHSFCEKCLVNYFGNDKVKPCPVCRQETTLPVQGGVSGIKTNGYIITLRDKIELQEKVAKTSDKAQRTCELCTKDEVTHHCLNCSQNICESCKSFHPRIKGMADHTVGTMEDIRKGKVTLPKVQKEYTCNKHKGEINRFYCETCQVLICRDCTVVNHCKPEHQYIDCAAASSKYKEVLNKIFPKFTNEIEKFEGSLKNACTAQREFKKKVLHTAQEVKKGADRLRDKVKAEEDRILGEIRFLKEGRSATFEEHITSMKSLLQRKQNTLAIARDVTKKGSDSDFLSLFPIINQDFNFLRSYVPLKIDHEYLYLRLDRALKRGYKLGVSDFGDTKWELFREVCRFGKEEGVSVAALRGDKLATAMGGRLVIFDAAGRGLEKTIKTKESYCDVASFHYGPVAVGDSGYFQFYNEDLTPGLSFQFPALPPKGDQHTCMCIKKDGTVLVGNSSKNVIFLINRRDGSLKHTISLKKSLWFLATDSNDRVVVSGFDYNQVIVIDDHGVTLAAIKPTMNGKPVKYCSGVCCDGSDICVAVRNRGSGSGHIHRYDGDGTFISCIVQGLHRPAGITLTEDGQHLAVVDDKAVKIYRRV